MDIDITLKNYRCFTEEHPAILRFRPGFSAFIGKNRQFLALRWIHANPALGGRNAKASVSSGHRFFVHVKPVEPWREEPHHGAGDGFRGRIKRRI